VKVLGRGGLFIKFMGFGGAVMFLVFAILTATGPSNSLPMTLGDATLFGLLAAVLVLAATTSVRLDGRDLVLVRLFSVTPVPLARIKRASGSNGLEIVTRDGATHTHIGYGSSLIGSLTGNRRSTRVAAAVTDAVQRSGPSATAALSVSLG
jgi:hypothetical protein